jgi:hypothetical protein
MQLEALNDEVHDFQQTEVAGKNPFGSDPFGSDPFASNVEDDSFSELDPFASNVEDDGFSDFNASCAAFDLGDALYSDDEEEDADNFW